MRNNPAIPAAPLDDGTVERALAEIDIALSDWIAAVNEVRAAIDDRPNSDSLNAEFLSDRPVEVGSSAAELPLSPVLDESAAGDSDESHDADDPGASEVSTAAPAAPSDAEAAPDPDSADSERGVPSELIDLLSDEECDALLLAALDPATAYAIRVKRRMTEKPMSVSELMDGFWGAGESSNSGDDSSKWWRKRKKRRKQ